MRRKDLWNATGVLFVVWLTVCGAERSEAAIISAFGDAGHSSSGDWFPNGTGLAEHYQFPTNNGATSTWEFTGLANGTYYVAASWTSYSNRTTTARFSMTDGGGDVVIDEQDATRDFYEFVSGTPIGWKNLGTVTVSDGNFSVMLSDDDDGGAGTQFLMADAIRLDTIPGVTTLPGLGKGTVIDDGDPGHQFLGEGANNGSGGGEAFWVNFGGGFGDDDYADDEDVYTNHTGVLQSQWTFTGLTPGVPTDISALWVPFSNRATNAPFTVSGIVGGDQTFLVDQQPAPNPDAYEADTVLGTPQPFQSIGTVVPTGTSIVVTLSNDANGFVIADAVRVEQIPEPTTAVLCVVAGLLLATGHRRRTSA